MNKPTSGRGLQTLFRLMRTPSTWVLLGMVVLAIAANTNHRSHFAANRLWAGERPSLVEMQNKQLQREGTVLNEVRGRFRISKDRREFDLDDTTPRTYKCLENLMLQRIDSSISNDNTKLVWIVTGKLTEYNGENYLFVERAVRAR